MRLRNKKTGEIGDLIGSLQSPLISICIDCHKDFPREYSYDSIEKINEDWEDYKLTEPLVERRSQRAVLRAAARLADTDVATVLRSKAAGGIVIFDFGGKCRVELNGRGIHVKDHGVYSLTQLCGEEE